MSDPITVSKPDEGRGQFELLKERRFLPFFVTQFLGAFNDNVFKNTLILLLAFYTSEQLPFSSDLLINAAALLFILPFFLFSATAGQLADQLDKAILIRRVKSAEIMIMLLGAAALMIDSWIGLYLILFLMGTQSSFFGPAKYALLPQHLREDELVGGNAQVEMGTFVAIVLGLIFANLLIALEGARYWVAGAIVTLAICGRFSSHFIPSAPPSTDKLKINWNIGRETMRIMRYAREDHSVFYSILGVSWFWFLGSVVLTQMPNFSRVYLHGSADVTTMVLCVFSVGIAVGSLLCERLSGKQVEIGLVPFGALGLSLATMDLYFTLPLHSVADMLSISAYLDLNGAWRVLVDLFLIGMFGGFFIVPLFAFVQIRTPAKRRAQVIAANNIINSLFMVVAALMGMIALEFVGMDIPQLFLTVALMNLAVAYFVFSRVPEFGMRFIIWLLSHTMYRVEHSRLDLIPDEGPTLLVSNHVSYVDALLLAGAVRRPIRFIMFKPIFDLPVLNFVFRTGGAIPIISQHVDAEAYERAMDDIAQGLSQGDLLCIFPEGKLTQDGEMNEFKAGVERITERSAGVTVVPLALQGLWGSFFSHRGGHAFSTLPRRFWSRIKVVAGEPLEPGEHIDAADLHRRVLALRGDQK